ncbi:glutathione S-transferase N-terminal domain-containing protein [Anderseniella sp. Alg231-50]|uniref:glutathione S-transferase N-terminal domain-containing protein n=1 Tax=Anderseniella sp. Alg231-50 TaxID=1922226 RepID=UPI000D54B9B1
MTITVHTFSGSPRGWRVLLGLAFKDLSWDTNYLSLADRDHRKPEFLSLNPRHTVPVVEADGVVLRDSIAILAWLDREIPDKPLFGNTPGQAAEIWQIAMECCDYLRDANRQLLSEVFFGDDAVPARGTEKHKSLRAAVKLVHAEQRYLEDLLNDGRPYLAGGVPSAADAVAFPEVRLLQRALETKHHMMTSLGFEAPEQTCPQLAAWKVRIEALPGVAATSPAHWN